MMKLAIITGCPILMQRWVWLRWKTLIFTLKKRGYWQKNMKIFSSPERSHFSESRKTEFLIIGLTSILFESEEERDRFLVESNSQGVMTRPVWRLMNRLRMFENCQKGPLGNAEWFEAKVVNLPSSIKL